MTFEEWDAANGEKTWNGGRTSITEQYRAVWNAAIASVETCELCGNIVANNYCANCKSAVNTEGDRK